MIDTTMYNRATKWFRDMEAADPYDMRWGKFADAMDEVISTCVPVARCKDCIHRGKSEKCVLAAISEEKGFPLFMLDNRGDWFCADGERRDDDR